MPHNCEHEDKKNGHKKDNLTGQYYEWECMDCGFKKTEGRSYQHKELCEYIGSLKRMAKMKQYDKAYQAVVIIHNMTTDIINRMKKNKKGRATYLEEVF